LNQSLILVIDSSENAVTKNIDHSLQLQNFHEFSGIDIYADCCNLISFIGKAKIPKNYARSLKFHPNQ